MEVYISSNAFWALLISAIEVYKRECFGLLLGYRDHPNLYILEHAISYQTANRRHVGMTPEMWCLATHDSPSHPFLLAILERLLLASTHC